MLIPITILAIILGAVTAPGLIAQSLQNRRTGEEDR
jgi:hypothetical protein